MDMRARTRRGVEVAKASVSVLFKTRQRERERKRELNRVVCGEIIADNGEDCGKVDTS